MEISGYLYLITAPAVFSLFLSVTIQSRRSSSVIDRTPRPTLQEVRTYFCTAMHQYLERRYIQNLDVFLSLCEEYAAKPGLQDRSSVVDRLFNIFLDSQSPDFIHMDPYTVRTCQQRYRESQEKGELPSDLLENMEAFVKERMQSLLPSFFESKEFYTACKKPYGVLWRVVKLSRLSYGVCSTLLNKVMGSLLDISDNGHLSCVPHLSPQNCERFRSMSHRLNRHLLRLRRNLHIIGYLTKEACVRETMRETHASTALGGEAIHRLEGKARKNY